jgi:hypothetical protein
MNVFCRLSYKTELFNNILYTATDSQGYKAWSDITTDITYLKKKKVNDNVSKPIGAKYIYPNGIESYVAATTVAIGQDVYRCNVGPESSLCVKEAYDPSGKFGSDAWTKLHSLIVTG